MQMIDVTANGLLSQHAVDACPAERKCIEFEYYCFEVEDCLSSVEEMRVVQ